MTVLKQYLIPIMGLKIGVHKYEYKLDQSFFNSFENAPISSADIKVAVEIDKQVGIIELNFKFNGSFDSDCDRCLQAISIPISGDYPMIVKYGLENKEEEELIYITEDTSHLYLADYIYQFVILSLPIKRVYDCHLDDPKPCDEKMLKYLNNEDDGNTSSDWTELLDFDKN